MLKNKYLLQILSVAIPFTLWYLKPPAHFILILFLIQGLAVFYYGIHLISNSRKDVYEKVLLEKYLIPDDKQNRKSNLLRFGIILLIAGAVHFLVYYLAVSGDITIK